MTFNNTKNKSNKIRYDIQIMQTKREQKSSPNIFSISKKNHFFLSFKDHNKKKTISSRLIHMKQKEKHIRKTK